MKRRFLSLFLVFAMLIAFVPVLHTAEVEAAASINIGDYVQMGTYYGEPILWRCVSFEKISGYDSEGNPIIDSTDTVTEYQDGYLPLILSNKIICLKPFDAVTSANCLTGSHSRGSGRALCGSSCWADSNIRSWLNSSESAGNVTWLCGNPPSEDFVYEGYNDYADEAGFLTNFTQNELNAIKIVTQKSIVGYQEYSNGIYDAGYEEFEHEENTVDMGDYDLFDPNTSKNYSIEDVVSNYNTSYSEQVTDAMFFLDVKQVNTVYNNSSLLGGDFHVCRTTEECYENNEYYIVGYTTTRNKSYWLRSPSTSEHHGTDVRVLEGDGDVHESVAYNGGNGVRPAFYLNMETSTFASGSGTAAFPYTVSGVTVSDTNTVSNMSNDDISVLLNGTELSFDQPPIMINDRTMVPIRAIFEAMGYTVSWNDDTQTATASKGTDKIIVQIGNSTISYVTDGKSGTYECDTVPQIVNDRTLVPVRAIAESAGCTVDWNDDTQTVVITK